MGGVKGAFTKVIGMAKDQGVIKEVKKEEPKQEETKQAEAKEASETKRLIKAKKSNLIGGNNKVDIMLFKADWCGHCKNFKPVWDKISEAYNKKFNFIVYDADKQREKFEEYKVDAFPTVIIKNGNNKMQYDGDRTVDDFSNFLQSLN